MSEMACMTDVNRLRPVITSSTSLRSPSIITCNSFISLIVRISKKLPSTCFHSFACCSIPRRRELRLMLPFQNFEFRISFSHIHIHIHARTLCNRGYRWIPFPPIRRGCCCRRRISRRIGGGWGRWPRTFRRQDSCRTTTDCCTSSTFADSSKPPMPICGPSFEPSL